MPYLELDVLNNAPEPILGIDLGTTNSLAAIFREGRPEVLGDERGPIVVPSTIHFPDGGEPVVGAAARALAQTDPSATLFSIKRFMGRGLADVTDDVRRVPFEARETERGLVTFRIGGADRTPQELSALILAKVRDVARTALGTDVTRAVITVPAYFDDAQRHATRDAARLAGLDVARIVNEPTAASLAYGLDQRREGTVAVFDLGGGTFDVSILTIEEGVFRVLATAGDTHLGGDDLDQALVAFALGELGERVDRATRDDAAFLQGLRLAAERTKIALSDAPEADLHFVAPDVGLDWRRTIQREEFDELVAPLIERTLDACRRALADAQLAPDAIDEVVLVGGSTRVPAVRTAVRALFGREPHTELDPDHVVALGAAVQGHVLAGGTRDLLLLDVTPLSLGIETMGGAVAKIVDRNSPVPCQSTEGFTTYVENQTGLDFNVVQGERELAADCRSLGRFELKGIPPMPAGMPKVAVRFQIDADGILTVSAKEESTGTTAAIEVQPMHGLTDGEVEQMLQDSYDHAREDFDASRLANLKVEIGTMKRATEARLPDVDGVLDVESIQEIRDALVEADAACAADELERVKTARDALEQATLPLAAALMDDVVHKAVAGRTLDDVTG